MAEAILRDHLHRRGVAARVHSAGTLAWRGGASEGARDALRERGLDAGSHRSRRLDADLVGGADLVLAMTRTHAWAVARHATGADRRTFLPAELARLGGLVGPPTPGETVAEWAGRVAARRPDPRVPGRAGEEVADPAGEPLAVYRATAARLDVDLARVADLLVASPSPDPPDG